MAAVIAAPASGSGKTLLSLALLSWAQQKGRRIQAFKVGPDYLDAQLLSQASSQACRNLDLNLCGESWVRRAFHGYAGTSELTLVEGVMGLFDGIGSSSTGSTADVARLLGLPVVLVLDAGGQAASLGALVRGFRDHDPNLAIAGVVLNKVSSPRHRELLAEVLERVDVPMLGCLPRTEALVLPGRHLGLAPAHELDNPEQRRQAWAALASQHLDLERLEPLLQAPRPGPAPLADIPTVQGQPLSVALASDAAFHFRYQETSELLEQMGMPVLPWSPLADEAIPSDAKGLILPGGFPEQHAAQLSGCERSLRSLRAFVQQRPVYAECGGMLMLGERLTDLDGDSHSMAGLLPFTAQRGPLQVGYRRLQARRDSPVVESGQQLIGHEFHRWELRSNRQPSDRSVLWDIEGWKVHRHSEGWVDQTVHASWVHLHWASSTTICSRWRAALEAGEKRSPNASSAASNPYGSSPSSNAGAG
ncbi:cobyrinate a,c-diamide synthase [Synechococcus sp. AH-736-G21]|nr:cobyrinate a,c-diamide synthase [Synechococcus sp. AH-736-G21]